MMAPCLLHPTLVSNMKDQGVYIPSPYSIQH